MSRENVVCPVESYLPDGWSSFIEYALEYPKELGIYFDVNGVATQDALVATIATLKSNINACEKCHGNPSAVECGIGEILLSDTISVAFTPDKPRFTSHTVVKTGFGTPAIENAKTGWRTYKGRS
jgi:hypothetical protein